MVPLSFEYLLDTAIPDRNRGAFAVVFVALIVVVLVVAVFGLWFDYLYAQGLSGMLVDVRGAMAPAWT